MRRCGLINQRCGLIEITCPSGPRGGIRPGPGGDVIMFAPKAQKGVGVFLACTNTMLLLF